VRSRVWGDCRGPESRRRERLPARAPSPSENATRNHEPQLGGVFLLYAQGRESESRRPSGPIEGRARTDKSSWAAPARPRPGRPALVSKRRRAGGSLSVSRSRTARLDTSRRGRDDGDVARETSSGGSDLLKKPGLPSRPYQDGSAARATAPARVVTRSRSTNTDTGATTTSHRVRGPAAIYAAGESAISLDKTHGSSSPDTRFRVAIRD